MAYSATMTGLYSLWYKDHPLTSFHFFNDNAEWNQMDKVGHVYSCYYEGVLGIKMMKWAGYNHRTSSIVGGAYGFFIQTGVEVLDGFSEAWGASTGDLLANALGSGLVIGQSLAWDEQRIWMKYSYSPSRYASIRPDLLGTNAIERVFKDYNGQTYWLSVNPHAFAPESAWPRWLNISIGYGVNGLLGGMDNIFEDQNGQVFDYSGAFHRGREWYISPDIDLSRIRTDSKALKVAFTLLNSLKFPMPTLGYGPQGEWSFYPIKF